VSTQHALQVDKKVDELRGVVLAKEAEIAELRARLNRAVLTASSRAETEADRERQAAIGSKLHSWPLKEQHHKITNISFFHQPTGY
jgi:hypothetical protein